MYIDMSYVELLNSIIATCDRIHDCSLLVTLFKIFANDCNDRSGFTVYACFCYFLINYLIVTF